MNDEIEACILAALSELRQRGEIPEGVAFDRNSVLVGREAILDSHGLVRVLLAVEEHVEDRHGKTFDWTSDRAMSARNSPMRTVATLAAFAVESSE